MKRTFTIVTEVDSEEQFADLFFAVTLCLQDRATCGDERGDLMSRHLREFRFQQDGIQARLAFHDEPERGDPLHQARVEIAQREREEFHVGDRVRFEAAGWSTSGLITTVTSELYEVPYGGPVINTLLHPQGVWDGYFTLVNDE